MIWSSWFENHLRGKSWSRTLDPVNKTASISLLLYIRAYDSLFTFTKYGLAIHKKYYSCTISVVVYIFIFDSAQYLSLLEWQGHFSLAPAPEYFHFRAMPNNVGSAVAQGDVRSGQAHDGRAEEVQGFDREKTKGKQARVSTGKRCPTGLDYVVVEMR